MADRIDDINNSDVQHGIDDDAHNDGRKGLELGALGGGAVGAIAGLAAGPIGAIVGAIVGGTAGSIASGAAVDAVDSIDNDDTVTGIGGTDRERDLDARESAVEPLPGNDALGVQTGAVSEAPLTREMVGADATRLELAAEELSVNKTRQQAGEVEIHKEIVQEQVEIPVTLEREELVITRHAVDRDLAPGEIASDLGEDEVVRIPLTQEVANVSTTARVVEEVEIGKRTVTENQTVTGTVRHEELDVNDSTNRM